MTCGYVHIETSRHLVLASEIAQDEANRMDGTLLECLMELPCIWIYFALVCYTQDSDIALSTPVVAGHCRDSSGAESEDTIYIKDHESLVLKSILSVLFIRSYGQRRTL